MASIFTRIVQGELPCYKIAETDDFFAFLDINPIVKGHTLAIPKKEIDYFFDLDDELLEGLMTFSKRVAGALKAAIECKRVGVIVAGLEVPHAHVHLVPFQTESQLSFSSPKLNFSADEMMAIAASIREHL